MRRGLFLPLTIIPLAAIVAVLPLVLHGCSCGHDFDFHLVSWMEAAAQFRTGVWHPAWAFSPAWNAGEPRFVFYPPLSWTLGALLGMMLPWGAVPVVYTWLALLAAGFAMYTLARKLMGSQAGALIAAAVYVANPYMIFTAYERTAYAELLAAAWIPLLLAAILRERVTVLRVAIPVMLLWLTNAPAAVMGCYALALLAAVRLVWMGRGSTPRACAELAARIAGGTALGLGLAAFYVVPAAYERRWVQIAMAMVEGMRIGDNFLFHHTSDGPHDAVLRTASMIAVGMLVGAFAVLGMAAMRMRGGQVADVHKRAISSIALLVSVIAILLTPLSAAIWRIAPEMAFLQFPWRLTAVLAAAACAAVSLALASAKMRSPVLSVGVLVLVAALAWPTVHIFTQICDDEDTVTARVALFASKTGTDPTDEYTPGEADNDVLAHANPPFWLAESGDALAPQGSAGPAPMRFAVNPDKAEMLILNLHAYPAWRVRVNGVEVKERTERADGLIAFPVTAGRSQIDVKYAMTEDRLLGDGISLVALIAAIGLAGWGRVPSGSRIIES